MRRLILTLVFCLFTLYVMADDFVIDEPGGGTSSSSSYSPPQNETRQPRTDFSGYRFHSIGSVPSPYGLPRGCFDFGFTFYDSGGVNARFIVGIMDMITIGISENLDGLIGQGKVNVNIPGAYVKLNIIRDLNNFNWALGFDNFAYGKGGSYLSTNEIPSTIYGFYNVVGWGYSALGGNDVFTLGFRIPLLPAEVRNFTNTSLILGATMAIPKYITFAFTIENIYIDFTRSDSILPSFMAILSLSPPFKISLILQYDFTISQLNRILSLSYESCF